MAAAAFTDEEFDRLEAEVAAFFLPAVAAEVEEQKAGRMDRILAKLEGFGLDQPESDSATVEPEAD